MEPKNKLKAHLQELRFLKRIIAVLILLLFITAYAVYTIPRQITVYQPPDVSKAFSQEQGSVPLETVYHFARLLWENINYCEEDCNKEYLQQLDKYSGYLSKDCKRQLSNHFEKHRGSYQYRNRVLVPTENPSENLFSSDKVERISSNVWYANLTYILKDDVRGLKVRNNKILYPLKIIRSNRPRAVNPLRLEVDCYIDNQGPRLLEKRETK